MKNLVPVVIFAASLLVAIQVTHTVVTAAAAATRADSAEWESFKELYKRPDNIPYPKDNPYSDAKATLGKTLFFETRISRSGVMSCATCHNPALNWTDGNAKGIGDLHKELPRKDPTLLNLAWDKLLFWDGRSEGLEAQALVPLQAEGEMHMPLDKLAQRLKDIKGYKPLFASAFPKETDPIRAENVGKAIATYERTIVSDQAPFDQWINGQETAISASAKRGFLIFNTKARCILCHSGWSFSDGSFHDTGLKDDDIGRGKFVPLPAMQHAFKTVGLRNIAQRPPYMHNGSLATLKDVIDHYDHGFVARESTADDMTPLHLTEPEKSDLIEFLRTLTSEDKPVTIPVLPQ